MKVKVLGLAIASLLIYSCASKKVAQNSNPEAKKETVAVKNETAEVAVMLTEEQQHGKGLYEQNCAKCHKLFSPSKHDVEGWKSTLAVMQKKAKISDADTASIQAYLTAGM